MRAETVTILSVDEVKSYLVDFYVSLTEDKTHMRELIEGGEIKNFFPDVNNMKASDFAQQFYDLDVVSILPKPLQDKMAYFMETTNDDLIYLGSFPQC